MVHKTTAMDRALPADAKSWSNGSRITSFAIIAGNDPAVSELSGSINILWPLQILVIININVFMAQADKNKLGKTIISTGNYRAI